MHSEVETERSTGKESARVEGNLRTKPAKLTRQILLCENKKSVELHFLITYTGLPAKRKKKGPPCILTRHLVKKFQLILFI